MHSEQRILLRVAAAVERRLARYRQPALALPRARWSHLQELCAQVHFCRQRGMAKAEERVRRNMQWQARRLHEEIAGQIAALEEDGRRATSSTGDIYRELVALKREFGGIACNLKEGTVSVTTQPIVLRDVHLGPFRIELAYRLIGSTDCYRVIATQPKKPCGDSHATHPHVRNDSLCEGDGKAAINAALRDGRLYDFFLLVSQVLTQYNAGNSYADLSSWTGVECRDCGETIDTDDAYCCGLCGCDVCRSCVWICLGCREEMCSDCTSACARCHRTHCAGCLTKCSVCQASICIQCREGGQCRSCRAANQETTNDEISHSDKTVSDPADAESDAITASSAAGAAV